jgi:hypothetical protein
MSLLYLRARPVVAFDPTNPEHRKWYREFTLKRSWGHCPVRFMAESLATDLVTHINGIMLEWYVKQEFKNGRKVKATNTKKPKPKSKGASGTVRRKQSVSAKTNQI